jgi:hypothetical protein
MKAKNFDKAFDDDLDISQYLDVSKARRPQQAQMKIYFPTMANWKNVELEKRYNKYQEGALELHDWETVHAKNSIC